MRKPGTLRAKLWRRELPRLAPSRRRLAELHRGSRIGWLRAAVLGANDGIVSTASLVLGVAAAGADRQTLLLTSLSGLIGGAMSMAAGEFVSVHAQADTEDADKRLERAELQADPQGERAELAHIYVGRGVTPELADQVVGQLMAHDALGAHLRDELGLSEAGAAQPLQAAWSSAVSFASGASLPILVIALAPPRQLILLVSMTSVLSLAALGAISARAGGAPAARSSWRVACWGAFAMAVTAAAGALFGVVT